MGNAVRSTRRTISLTCCRAFAISGLLLVSHGALANWSQQLPQKLKGGYPACVTPDLFGEIGQAITSNDNERIKYLLRHGCVVTRVGVRFELLGINFWSGAARIRLNLESRDLEVWTNIANVD